MMLTDFIAFSAADAVLRVAKLKPFVGMITIYMQRRSIAQVNRLNYYYTLNNDSHFPHRGEGGPSSRLQQSSLLGPPGKFSWTLSVRELGTIDMKSS